MMLLVKGGVIDAAREARRRGIVLVPLSAPRGRTGRVKAYAADTYAKALAGWHRETSEGRGRRDVRAGALVSYWREDEVMPAPPVLHPAEPDPGDVPEPPEGQEDWRDFFSVDQEVPL